MRGADKETFFPDHVIRKFVTYSQTTVLDRARRDAGVERGADVGGPRECWRCNIYNFESKHSRLAKPLPLQYRICRP
jgi:hypothetical protein